MRYGEGVWEPLAEAVVQREIMGVLRAAKAEKIRPTASLLRSVETLSRVVVTVPDEEWDADTDVLVCTNGTLHIPTGELREHDMMPAGLAEAVRGPRVDRRARLARLRGLGPPRLRHRRRDHRGDRRRTRRDHRCGSSVSVEPMQHPSSNGVRKGSSAPPT